MPRPHDDAIRCPKCRAPWEGNESDAMFLPYATCAECGQRYRADEVTVFVTEALQERWITREGPGGWGVLHPDRECAVFVAACAATIAEILGYAVDLRQHGVEGNGHGAWDVVPMETP